MALAFGEGSTIRGSHVTVYESGVYVGWIEWRFDHRRPAWYFESHDHQHVWKLANYEDEEVRAVRTFRKRYYAAMKSGRLVSL